MSDLNKTEDEMTTKLEEFNESLDRHEENENYAFEKIKRDISELRLLFREIY